MLVVLVSVCVYGATFGIIQAAMDPENKRGRLACLFALTKEIKKCEPIGIVLGIFFATLIEYLRQ